MACSYSLKIGNTVKQYDNYADLFNDLLNNKIKIESGQLSDIVFSEDVRQSETVALVNKIRNDITLERGELDILTGELKDKVDSNYISVSDYIETATQVNGNPLIPVFNMDAYKNQKINELAENGVDRNTALLQIEEELKSWEAIADASYNAHAVINQFFQGNQSNDGLYSIFGDKFDKNVIDQFTSELHKVKDAILRRHGNDAQLIPNVQITTDLVNDNKKLIGSIDLLVVDNKGQAHIYSFKASSKQSAHQINIKKEKQDYVLAFYRQILAAKGLSAKKMGLNIVPLQILGLETGKVTSMQFEPIEDRQVEINGSNGTNRLQWEHGEFSRNVGRQIPVTLTQESLTAPIRDKVIANLATAFPNKQIKVQRRVFTRDEFIKGKYVTNSTKPGYTWMFVNMYVPEGDKNRYIHIKDPSPKESNAELVEKVDAYLEEMASAFEGRTDKFIDDLADAIEGKLDLAEISQVKHSALTQAFINNTFGRYCNGDWTLVDNEKLRQLGIVAIQNNVSKQVDIISLAYHSGNLNKKMDLGLGTSILGAHVRDSDAVVDDYLLRASNGNIDLMKVMFALNEIPEWFNGIFKVGNIRVVDPITSQGTVANSRTVRNSFRKLCEVTKIKSNLDQIDFMPEFDMFRQEVAAALNNNVINNSVSLNNIYAELEKIDPFNTKEVVKNLKQVEAQMRQQYTFLGDTSQAIVGSREPIAELYILLWKTIYAYEGNFSQLEHIDRYSGRVGDKTALNGTFTNNPATVGDRNLRRMTEMARGAFDVMTQRMANWYEPFRNEEVQALWDSKGYSIAQNTLFGNQNHLYENMYRTNPDGSINDRMLLKDPYNDPTLEEGERRFLKKFLWTVNTFRFGLEGKSENDPEVKALMTSEKWFWLPLVEATTGSKMQQNPKEMVKQNWDDFRSKIQRAIGRDQNGDVYTESEENDLNEGIMGYTMFNRFSFSEKDDNTRLELLSEYRTNFWERNLETVLTKYVFANVRKQELDKVLPMIKGLRLLAEVYKRETGEDNKAFDEFIENYMNIAIYNKSILAKESKYISQYLGPMKFLGSTMALGLNVTTGVREIMEGAWKVMGRTFSQFYQGEEQFTKAEWLKAMGIIVSDSGDFMQRVTLIEAINQRFRMANMDMNMIAERMMSDKSGLLNFKDRALFWFSTSPDYFNRMSMLIAKMIHDGTWDACSFDQKGFKYDWKKDKRFAAYASGNQSNPEYNKQRGLYLSHLRLANQEYGLNLKEGDALPLPYTQKQIFALKDFSDITFGFYDHDVRAHLEKTFLGSLIMQFKTYLSATKTMYFLKPDAYNLGARRQMIDEKTGKPLFWKHHVNEAGEKMDVPTTEDTGEPMYDYGNGYMEGIFWSLYDIFKAWKKGGIREAKNEMLSNEVKVQNMKQLGYNLFVLILLAGLSKFLIDMWKEHREANKGEMTVSQLMSDQSFNLFTKAYLGSFQDFNVVQSFTGFISDSEPASFSIMNNFFNSSKQMIFGDRTLASWLKSNSGFYRSFSGVFDGIQEMNKAAENSLQQVKP